MDFSIQLKTDEQKATSYNVTLLNKGGLVE